MGKYAVIFLDFQVCCSLKLCRVFTYMKQRITGTSWDEMLDSFKTMVSLLYAKWKKYLWDFLDPEQQETFQSIRRKTASDGDLRISLELLSLFLAEKSGQKVIVLIDEYEAPNNRAYEHGFFKKVCPLSPHRLYSTLTTMIQANEFFGRGVLPPFLKVGKVYLRRTSNVLIQTNEHIAYGLLAGVTPTAKAGWYSGLNNIQVSCMMLARRSST
jgi:hypothetical protein